MLLPNGSNGMFIGSQTGPVPSCIILGESLMNTKIPSNMVMLGFSKFQRVNLMKRHKDVLKTVLGWHFGGHYSGSSSVLV